MGGGIEPTEEEWKDHVNYARDCGHDLPLSAPDIAPDSHADSVIRLQAQIANQRRVYTVKGEGDKPDSISLLDDRVLLPAIELYAPPDPIRTFEDVHMLDALLSGEEVHAELPEWIEKLEQEDPAWLDHAMARLGAVPVE